MLTTVTSIDVAPSTTWWLVTTSPSLPITMPVPAASPSPKPTSLVIVTSPADWAAVAAAVSRAPRGGGEAYGEA